MNRISSVLAESEFIQGSIPSITIDGELLATLVARSAPEPGYTGLVSSLLPPEQTFMNADERANVRAAIFPADGVTAQAPILMCPDDLDLSCTVVFAEVRRDGETVTWLHLGVERPRSERDERGSTNMEWWPGVGPFTFPIADYRACLAAFDEEGRLPTNAATATRG